MSLIGDGESTGSGMSERIGSGEVGKEKVMGILKKMNGGEA